MDDRMHLYASLFLAILGMTSDSLEYEVGEQGDGC